MLGRGSEGLWSCKIFTLHRHFAFQAFALFPVPTRWYTFLTVSYMSGVFQPSELTIAFHTLLPTVHSQPALPCLPDSIARSKPCMPCLKLEPSSPCCQTASPLVLGMHHPCHSHRVLPSGFLLQACGSTYVFYLCVCSLLGQPLCFVECHCVG